MQSVKAPLKYWLKQQHYIIGNCVAAVLVHAPEGNHPKCIAQIPDTVTQDKYIPDQATALAIKNVIQKQRLHLTPVDNNEILMAQPILHQGKFWGAVILRIASDDKKVIADKLKLLQNGMIWLQFLLTQQDAPSLAPASLAAVASVPDSPAEQLLQMTNKLLKENSLQEMAISLVNILATQLQASRVSFGVYKNTGVELTAVSFSANFDKRTSAMQAISDCMDEAVDQRINVHLEQDTATETSAIQRCHEILLLDQQAAALDTFLLRKGSHIIGAITIEYKHSKLTQEQQFFLQSALPLTCDLIALRQNNENNIRQQIKSRIFKKLRPLLGEKNVARKLTGITAFLILCVLLFPANYWITSDASLQSTYKYLVVSPQDGYLESIKVRPGAQVKKGDVLAQLNDDDLRLERRKLFSQLQQSQQEYDNALANANRAQAAIANEKVEQANSQLQLIEQQQSRTQLVASSDGIITSDDISQTLGTPVKQGQMLFEISASQGYLVQIWVDEKDIAALKPGQASRIKLTSIPNEIFDASVKSITPISEIREGKNYFRVEATLNRETSDLRPGMTGSGKVLAGRECLGWIWFHDAWYWLRLKLWF